MKLLCVNVPCCYNQNNDGNSTVLESAEQKKLNETQAIQRNNKKMADMACNSPKEVKT